MTHVLFSESVKSDLLEAWLFVAEESIDAADAVIEAIHQEAQTLALQPLMGRLRSELAEGYAVGQHRRATSCFIFQQKMV